MSDDTPQTAMNRGRVDELLDRLFACLLAHDMAGFADCFAPHGTFDFPFAAPGYPEHLGDRQEITDYLAHYPELLDVQEILAQRRMHTVEPGTVVVEFEIAGRVVGTGRPYQLRYIAVISVGDEGIENYRDYWSPAAAEAALGAPIDEVGDQLLGGTQ